MSLQPEPAHCAPFAMPQSSPVPETFVDGVMDVDFVAGVFRVRLGVVDKPADGGEPGLSPRHVLILGPEGFAGLVENLNGVMERLVRDGVFELDDPSRDQPDGARGASSPNFE